MNPTPVIPSKVVAPLPLPGPETGVVSVDKTLRLGLDNLKQLQADRGSWPGDYGGPMFLLPMYVALTWATGRVPQSDRREQLLTYFTNVQRADGSIGLHAEATSGSMFTTALSYVSMRVLGLGPEDERMVRMRGWLRDHGSPLGAASWGKFTLCLLGLYDWRGIHPLQPEFWLLPKDAPMHPRRLWCHARQVYLPMAWLYGMRSTMPSGDPLQRALRDELYDGRWSSIAWEQHRDTVSKADDYRPTTPGLKATYLAENTYERLPFKPLRKRALAECLKHIQYEDRVTNDIDIGPVNAVLNTFVHHFRGAEGRAEFERGFAALEPYLWLGHDGLKMQGYNNSELWDTAFAVQAILATPAAWHDERVLHKAYGYLRDNQILEDVPDAEAHYRHASKGGWPFSNRAHGWPITDCTSEGFKCALALEGRYSHNEEIPLSLLRDSVRLILSWQNEDGGWATYEKQRAGAWMEQFNPSQVFGDIMVDYSYVECTSACLQALVAAKRRFGGEFELDEAIARGVAFLRSAQRPDGSFEGCWAVCFTYGTWFGVTGLLAAGVSVHDAAIRRACQFLLKKQRADGSWSEHGNTCREREWVEGERGHVAQTSWALLALVRAQEPNHEALHRAAAFLCGRQEADGSWAREPLVGVFNRTCLINYDNYRHYFPVWALAKYRALFNEQAHG